MKPDKKIILLYISRLLSPKNQTDLLAWVRLAYAGECSVKKSLGIDALTDKVSSTKKQC